MRKIGIAAMLAAGLAIGSLAGVHAKLPAPAPMSDADKAAKDAKDAAAKAAAGEQMNKAVERVVTNYKKNKGIAMDGKPAPQKASAKK